MAEIKKIPGLEVFQKFGKSIGDMLVEKLQPRLKDEDSFAPLSLRKTPYPAQATRIEALARQLEDPNERTALLMGDMGTGKTLMSLGIAERLKDGSKAKAFNLLITCPPSLVSTWTDEIYESLPPGSYQFVDYLAEKPLPTSGTNIQIMTYSKLRMHYSSEFYALNSFRSERVQLRLEKMKEEYEARFMSDEEQLERLAVLDLQQSKPFVLDVVISFSRKKIILLKYKQSRTSNGNQIAPAAH